MKRLTKLFQSAFTVYKEYRHHSSAMAMYIYYSYFVLTMSPGMPGVPLKKAKLFSGSGLIHSAGQ